MQINKLEAVKKLWEPVEHPPKIDQEKSRNQLHDLLQFPAAAADSLLRAEEDNSHLALEWKTEKHAMVGKQLDKKSKVAIGVDFRKPALLLLEDSEVINRQEADGETTDSLLDWLRDALSSYKTGAERINLEREYRIPETPQQQGEPFDCQDEEGFAMMASYFSNADLVLRATAESHPSADPVRCWPHHFDLATLLHFEKGDESGIVGIGMAAGDNLNDEPYFYVAPWPRPEGPGRLARQLPEFPQAGRWHATEGWFGALLSVPVLVKFDSGEEQAQVAVRFLEQAIGQCRNLLK